MHIHLLQAVREHGLRSSKDTNGGFGTVNDYGEGFAARVLKRLKNRTMNFPELLPAYVHAALKQRGHRFTFAENAVDPRADIVLLQTSITNFHFELGWAEHIRAEHPGVKIGFIGGMAAGNPERYRGIGDFVITGEAEHAFLTLDPEGLDGVVEAGLAPDLDALPFPDWSHLENWEPAYGFLRGRRGRFVPMLGSRGCPMSCAFYCTYPLVQGKKFRMRSVDNLVAEIEYLQRDYGVTTVMFRDPIFSLRMDHVEALCREILRRDINLSWICETHPKFLSDDLIRLMAQAGCTTVKLGIESGNLEVMKKSRRALPELSEQERVIRALEEQGIDVLGFYILGYSDDDAVTVRQTIDYAVHLNTFGAQFTIATPYPGTPWYDQLRRAGPEIRLDENLENYNQYQLVYDHPNLAPETLNALKSEAYRRYYFRPGFFWKHWRRLI